MANERKTGKKTEALDKEATRRAKEEQARRGRRRMRQLIGLALTVLIVVGAVSIVRGGIDLAQNLMNDTSEVDTYNQRLSSLVWFDLLPFESLSAADPNAIKQAVVWGVLNELGGEVEYDELGRPLVPAAELDLFAAQLFGPDYKLEHASFEDPVQSLSYEYDPVAKVYAATATGLNPQYMGNVVQIERMSGGIKRVTVGYVSTMNSNDELIPTLDLSRPSKYMDYFFRRDGNEYYLYALRANTSYVPPEAASSSSSSGSAAQPASLAAAISGLESEPGSSLPPASVASSLPPSSSQPGSAASSTSGASSSGASSVSGGEAA